MERGVVWVLVGCEVVVMVVRSLRPRHLFARRKCGDRRSIASLRVISAVFFAFSKGRVGRLSLDCRNGMGLRLRLVMVASIQSRSPAHAIL